MAKKDIAKVKEEKVTLSDIHEKVVIVVGTTNLILSQQNEISKATNVISNKHNELLEELKNEIKHGNESRVQQTTVLSQMTAVLGKSTDNNTAERLSQNDKGLKMIGLIALVIIVGLLLVSGVIVIQDLKEIKEILPVIG